MHATMGTVSRWQRSIPSKDSHSLLTTLIFLVTLALFIALAVTEKSYIEYTETQKAFPHLVLKLGDLANAITAEAEAAVSFSFYSSSATLYKEMTKTYALTDAAYSESFALIRSKNALHSWDTSFSLPGGGSIMTEQGMDAVTQIRSQMMFGEVVLDSQVTRSRYFDVIRHIVETMMATAHRYQQDVDYSPLIGANGLLSAVDAYLTAEYHASLYHYYAAMANPTSTDNATSELKQVLVALLTYQGLTQNVLLPLMNLKGLLSFQMKSTTLGVDNLIHDVVAEATKLQVLPEDLNVLEKSSIVEVRNILSQITAELSVSIDESVTSRQKGRFIAYLIFCVLCGAAFLASAVEFLYLRLFEARRSAQQRRNASVMHDVLVRVSEYVHEIVTFSLSPKPPPATMADRKISIVEMQMEYLLGSLQAIAPTLAPLLFPKRLQTLAEEYSDVKDPATMVLLQPPRPSLRDKKMCLQSTADPHPYLHAIAKKTDLQECVCEAALMFVSLTAFHDLGSADKRKFSSEYYHRVVSIVEECVYQHGGLVHSVSFDKVVAVWNLEDVAEVADSSELAESSQKPRSTFCELAACCGLALAARLNVLRGQKPLVRENLPVHIGIVGGTVNFGIFGCEAAKTVGIFGPPLLRGMLVAQANGFHMTSVACDDYVFEAIQKTCFCKPIELLPGGGCAFEVLRETDRDRSDLEVQLSWYTRAFELFERKHYKGALKAFRAYTKQYGYDSSVERIQFLISCLQTA